MKSGTLRMPVSIQVLEDLDARFPGIKEELCPDGSLRPDVSVVVGTDISALGMLQSVDEDSEIHFVPTIAGG